MIKHTFNTIQDVLQIIKENNYNRNLSSIIGFDYAFEEQSQFGEELDKYSFFFYFLDVEQSELTDEEFKNIILKLVSIENIRPLQVKEVLYEKELTQIEVKFSKNLINKEVYQKLKDKFLK